MSSQEETEKYLERRIKGVIPDGVSDMTVIIVLVNVMKDYTKRVAKNNTKMLPFIQGLFIGAGMFVESLRDETRQKND